jgi:hypothetical protein
MIMTKQIRGLHFALIATALALAAGGGTAQVVLPTQDDIDLAIAEQCGDLAKSRTRILTVGLPRDCRSNLVDCSSTVTVSPKSVVPGKVCTATWEYSAFDVRWKRGPRLFWELDEPGGDPEKPKYQFLDSSGVAAAPGGVHLCPKSANVPATDLDNGRCLVGSDCQTYQWKAVNKRTYARARTDRKAPHDGSGFDPAAIHFAIIVFEKATGKICYAEDPAIIIRGGN